MAFSRRRKRKRPIRDAMASVENAGAVGASAAWAARELIGDIDELLDDIMAQGFLELEIDITDHPLAEKLGLGEPVTVKIKLPPDRE